MAIQIFNAGGLGGGEAVKLLTVGSMDALPISAKENTLALVTTVAPGTIRLAHAAPDSPAEGDVWIMTSASGTRALQLGRKNLLTTYLVRGYQYVSGAWAVKDLYLRSGGAWQNMYTYLYSRGTEFVTAHGMGTMLGDNPSQISKGPNYFDAIVSATANNWKGCWWEAIDYTPYVTLRLVMSTPAATLSLGYSDASHIVTTLPTNQQEAQVDVNVTNLNATVKLWIGRVTAAADTFRVFEAYLI